MAASQGLLDVLASHMRMDRINLGIQRQRTVSFDNVIFVTFLSFEEERLTAVSYISEVNSDHPEVYQRWLNYNFAANALGGGHVSVDESSNSLVLTREWLTNFTTGEDFLKDIEMFVNLVGAIRVDTYEILEDAKAGKVIESVKPTLLDYFTRMA